MPDGIFGGLFDQNVHLRDSRHAAEAYGYNKAALTTGTPRFKFQYFVRFNFNRNLDTWVKAFLDKEDQELVTVAVKSVTMPSMQMASETLNQYNKKRISQTAIDFTPVTMTVHDTVEGRTLRLWEMYYEYYFKDGTAWEKNNFDSVGESRNFLQTILRGPSGQGAPRVNKQEYDNDILKERFNDNQGYNLTRVANEKYLIDSIDIFQVHGGYFSRTSIVNPRISAFEHDTLDYEDATGLMQLRFDFAYESVVYANVNEPLTDEELERYRYGDFWEMANLITIRAPRKGRTIVEIPEPRPADCSGNFITGALGFDLGLGDALQQSAVFQTRGGYSGDRNVTRITDTIGGVVNSIPDAIGTVASASIFGGEISFNPDPLQALRTTGNQVGRDVFNRARGGFGATVSQGVGAVLDGIVGGGDGG